MTVNKVILIGYVGKLPDIKYFEGGGLVASFRMATTEKGYKGDNIQAPDRAQWHNVVASKGNAKLVESFVKVGTQVYVEGKLLSRMIDVPNSRSYELMEVHVSVFRVLGGGKEREEDYFFPDKSAHPD